MNVKLFAILAMVLLMPSLAYAADMAVVKDMPGLSLSGQSLAVSFSITSEGAEGFDMVELVPKAWALEWDVEGIDKGGVVYEKKEYVYEGYTYQAHHWSFKQLPAGRVKLRYSLLPDVGKWKFISIWTYPGGFSTIRRSLDVQEFVTVAKTMLIIVVAAVAFMLVWYYRPWRPRLVTVSEIEGLVGKKIIVKAFPTYIDMTKEDKFIYWLYDTSGKTSAISAEKLEEDKLYRVEGTVVRGDDTVYVRVKSAKLA